MRPWKKEKALTWIINPSLDDVVQCKAAGGFLVPQVCVHLRGEYLGHVVVVLAEVGVLLLSRVVHLQLVVSVAERHCCGELRGEKNTREERLRANGESEHSRTKPPSPYSRINTDVTVLKRPFPATVQEFSPQTHTSCTVSNGFIMRLQCLCSFLFAHQEPAMQM